MHSRPKHWETGLQQRGFERQLTEETEQISNLPPRRQGAWVTYEIKNKQQGHQRHEVVGGGAWRRPLGIGMIILCRCNSATGLCMTKRSQRGPSPILAEGWVVPPVSTNSAQTRHNWLQVPKKWLRQTSSGLALGCLEDMQVFKGP